MINPKRKANAADITIEEKTFVGLAHVIFFIVINSLWIKFFLAINFSPFYF